MNAAKPVTHAASPFLSVIEKAEAKKVFVLDTNVLIHDPDSIFKFDNNDIVIPLVVIEELDRLKKGQGEIAFSARQALRIIDSLRERGQISRGVRLDQGGTLSVSAVGHDTVAALLDSKSEDNKIIGTALSLMNTNPRGLKDRPAPVMLVSKDMAVRIKAESCGLHAEDYRNDKTSIFKQYGNILAHDDYTNGIHSARYLKVGDDIYRLTGKDRETKIRHSKSVEGIAPKNTEQCCAIDALLNPEIEVIALTGAAGTGKTLLALAAGIHQATKKSPLYEQTLVARPVVPMGNDIGYLPGDIHEKLAPWMQPIFDNIEVIVNTPKEQLKDNTMLSKYRSFQYLLDTGVLQVEPLTYIRGRSLPKRYFIVDEAQNLRPIDVKTIITRCGEGTKIVFTGDLNQIYAIH